MPFKTICTMAATATFVMLGVFSAEAGKEVIERTKPHANVGTIGHVDHSKTPVGRQVKLPGIGKFTLVDRKAGTGLSRNFNDRRMNKKVQGPRHAPFSASYRPQFYFRTTDVTGRHGNGAASGLATEAGTAAAKRRYDLTPEEYRTIWGLSAD
jgi:hypothetical protein